MFAQKPTMSATVLTAADAEKAKIDLITDEAKGQQAVHDVVVAIQAARRSGTACAKTKADSRGGARAAVDGLAQTSVLSLIAIAAARRPEAMHAGTPTPSR